jgi:unsaturated rhamnogalacturonyl hydrolase
MQPWSIRMADSTLARFPLLADEWNYQPGLVLKGLQQVWMASGDNLYYDYIKKNIDTFVQPNGTIRGYRLEDYNVDLLNTGKVLFSLFERSGEKKYKIALELLRSQLDTHPRTREGGFWHKRIYPNQMWLDGIYMADAFYVQYETTFADGNLERISRCFDDVIHQITLIEEHTRDEKTGLLYHAWDESKQQRWANPLTGCSRYFWGRAVGWYVMALVDILDCLPADYPQRQDLMAILQRSLKALIQVQDSSGVWFQLLDQGTRPGNYLESSASCMFVYAMAKGVRKHYLPDEWLNEARRAYEGILQQFIQVDEDGQVHLTNTCRSAGLGGTPYRDGSYDYYVGEPIVTDNHHGVGAFLLASSEIEQLQ